MFIPAFRPSVFRLPAFRPFMVCANPRFSCKANASPDPRGGFPFFDGASPEGSSLPVIVAKKALPPCRCRLGKGAASCCLRPAGSPVVKKRFPARRRSVGLLVGFAGGKFGNGGSDRFMGRMIPRIPERKLRLKRLQILLILALTVRRLAAGRLAIFGLAAFGALFLRPARVACPTFRPAERQGGATPSPAAVPAVAALVHGLHLRIQDSPLYGGRPGKVKVGRMPRKKKGGYPPGIGLRPSNADRFNWPPARATRPPFPAGRAPPRSP